jgi:hypothetical protein
MTTNPEAVTFGGPTRDAKSEAAFDAKSTKALPDAMPVQPGTNEAVKAGLHAKAAGMVGAAGAPMTGYTPLTAGHVGEKR